MDNKYRLPKHMFPIASRYIIAAIIGSPFITACNHSRYGMSNTSNEHIAIDDIISDARPSASGDVEPAQEAQQTKESHDENEKKKKKPSLPPKKRSLETEQ